MNTVTGLGVGVVDDERDTGVGLPVSVFEPVVVLTQACAAGDDSAGG